MVPGHGAAAGSLTSLTGPLADWEGPPLQAILDGFRDRLGSVASGQVIGLALATIDAEVAAEALDGSLVRPAPPDGILGARGIATLLPSGRTLLVLEPATEGRLAAFLARHGEGLAAVYIEGAGLAGQVSLAGSAGEATAAHASVPAPGRLGRPRPTALGRPGRVISGERIGDAVIVLL